MKLCQFKSANSDQQRLGLLLGDEIVCDVAELGRAIKSAGGEPADWLLQVNSTLAVMQRGPTAGKKNCFLLDRAGFGTNRGETNPDSLLARQIFLAWLFPSRFSFRC